MTQSDVFEDLDDSHQVLDRRSCLVANDDFGQGDAEMLLDELKSFTARVKGRYPLGRLTLVRCGADKAWRSGDYRSYSVAQVLILGGNAEARLRLGGELRVIRLAGSSDLGRLQLDGFTFELYAFHVISNHIPVPIRSPLPEQIVLELRTSSLPPVSTGTQMLKMLESNFAGVRVGAYIKVGFEQPFPLDDRGFRQHEAYGHPFLQCGGHQCFVVLSGEPPEEVQGKQKEKTIDR